MSDFLTEKQKLDIVFFTENMPVWNADPLFKQKFVIISGGELRGMHDTYELALGAAVCKFNIGEFVIQQVISDDEKVSFLSPDLVLG